jgi:hypothetical protein
MEDGGINAWNYIRLFEYSTVKMKNYIAISEYTGDKMYIDTTIMAIFIVFFAWTSVEKSGFQSHFRKFCRINATVVFWRSCYSCRILPFYPKNRIGMVVVLHGSDSTSI